MSTLLIHNAHTVATQNDQGDELRETSVLVRDGLIAAGAEQRQRRHGCEKEPA